jgi:hypothetical protein
MSTSAPVADEAPVGDMAAIKDSVSEAPKPAAAIRDIDAGRARLGCGIEAGAFVLARSSWSRMSRSVREISVIVVLVLNLDSG